jgi:hypothetical protein
MSAYSTLTKKTRSRRFANAVLVFAFVMLQAGIVAHAAQHAGQPANTDLLHADEICALCVAQAGLDHAVPIVSTAAPDVSILPQGPRTEAPRRITRHSSSFQPRGPPGPA